MTKELAPEARDFERTKEEGHGFHKTYSVEPPIAHNNPWEFILVVIPRRSCK
jgi:hypothetical protein